MRTTTLRIGLGLATLAIVAAACGAERAGGVTDGPGSADAIEVTIKDFAFEPERIDVPAGESVEIEVTNEDGMEHDLTTDDASTGGLAPGDVATMTLTFPEGETPFVCSLHPNMQGTFVATPR
jgi:nitrite reductase (NO-forming)